MGEKKKGEKRNESFKDEKADSAKESRDTQEGWRVRYKPEISQIKKELCGTFAESPKPSAEFADAACGTGGATQKPWCAFSPTSMERGGGPMRGAERLGRADPAQALSRWFQRETGRRERKIKAFIHQSPPLAHFSFSSPGCLSLSPLTSKFLCISMSFSLFLKEFNPKDIILYELLYVS